MTPNKENRIDSLLDCAFSQLSFRENILMIFYAFFKPSKRDKFLDLLVKGYSGKEAFKHIRLE